jgi:PAS domain S-box-containing protein
MACSLAAIFVVLTAVCAAGSEPKRVLVIHSFSSAAPPFTIESRAFESALVKKLGEPVDLDEVSLDMARYADRDMQEAMVEYLRKRQAAWKPDLVVPIGSPSALFVANYRERLFPDTPIIYTAPDRRLLPAHALDKNATYIGQIYDIPRLVEDMLQIAPATKNIAVVVGATPLEQRWKEMFRQASEPLTSQINFIYLDDLGFDQMLERVATLPPDSFIFVLLLLRDAAGVTHNADEALQRLHAVANAPINSIFQHQLGLGIVGGRLYPGELVGEKAAERAVRILRGEPAKNFPPEVIDPLPPRYDWRELVRWKIDQKRLPPGSTILFRTPSMWQQYRGLIIGIFAIVAVQSALITGLLVNRATRRRAERALAESTERMGLAADAANLGMWVWDVSGDDAWMTEQGRAPFGFKPDVRIDYAALLDRVHPEDRAARDAAIKRALETQGEYELEYRVQLPDGGVRWISARGRCVGTANGNGAKLLGVSMDVTARKEAELETAEQRAELGHLSRVALVGEMATSLAHELNQPLAAILSNAQAARRFIAGGAIEPEELNAILDDIVRDDKRAGAVIQNLRAMVSKRPAIREACCLNDIVREVIELMRSERIEARIQVHPVLAPELPFVNAARVELQQVLVNLLVNAVHAMEDTPLELRIIEVETRAEADAVVVAVRDRGHGLPPERLAGIFDSFFTTKTTGLGMGLSICRRIIERHGGRIAARNHADGGATFSFRLPLREDAAR